MASPCKRCGGVDRYKGGACKRCHKVARDARYLAHKPQHLADSVAWAAANPEKVKSASFKFRLKRYGLTEDQYQSLLLDQHGLCKVCEEPLGVVHIDHDHDTGAVRGLLCHTCNVGMGHLKDDPRLLRKAAEYLEQSPSIVATVPARVYNEKDSRFKFSSELRERVRVLREDGLSLSEIARATGISKSGVQTVLQLS